MRGRRSDDRGNLSEVGVQRARELLESVFRAWRVFDRWRADLVAPCRRFVAEIEDEITRLDGLGDAGFYAARRATCGRGFTGAPTGSAFAVSTRAEERTTPRTGA